MVVEIKYTNTRVAAGEEMIPVSSKIPPVGEGKPATFTQYLQAPDVQTFGVEKAGLILPSGGHAVITGPMTEVVEARSVRTPLLSDLPGVGRLFTSVGYRKRQVRTLVLVSARVLPVEPRVKPR